MQIKEIIRAAIPDATDEVCEWVIWERTPYPFAKLTAKDIYKAASRVRRAGEKHKRLCECCDRITVGNDYVCVKCREVLNQIPAVEKA